MLPSRTPLDATSIRIGLDIDSLAWSFSADPSGRTSLDLAAPDANWPRTVELEINGWTWRFLVERYSGSGKASERALLDHQRREPHPTAGRALCAEAQRGEHGAAERTSGCRRPAAAHRLFSVLGRREHGAGLDASAGAFSYQDQTPMQVIVKLAEVAGGIVRPGLDGRLGDDPARGIVRRPGTGTSRFPT
ncbi:hypothetical protein P4234_00145 [Pseudomonas aeruginosa]|nr:hypothetical protein [Pseudomonas aeruginosa]